MKLLDLWIIRLGIAFWIMLQALSGVFDAVLVLSYKLHALRITEFLGLRTEGDDYRRFIPLMDGTSTWEAALPLLVSALYLAAIVQVFRRRRSAAGLLIAGLVLSAGPWIHGLGTPSFAQAFSPAHVRRDALLYFVTALLGVLLWQSNKSLQRPPQ